MMQNFILPEPGILQAIDMPEPLPGYGEVRVKIAYTGVCGSDVEIFLGHREPEFLTAPIMIGHEASGFIDMLGEGIVNLRVGDRVSVVGVWGCFTDYIIAKPGNLLKLLPEIPTIQGSLIEVLPGIIMAATTTGITAAHDVLIMGQGLSGLQITRMVNLQGCKKLIAVDLFDEKLEIAREFGATHTINASRNDISAKVKEIALEGVDVTIMATLDGNDVGKALDWTRHHGKIVLYGSIGPATDINFFRQHRKGISIIKEGQTAWNALERRRWWREGMQLVADGLLNMERLRTHILPMHQLPEAIALRSTPRADVIHVLLENDWAREKRERGEWF